MFKEAERLHIQYDNPSGVYLAGYNMSGCVVVETKEVFPVRAITLTLKGEGQVAWSVVKRRRRPRQSRSTNTHTVRYSDEKKYLDEEFILWRPEMSGQDQEKLPAGAHWFKFVYKLPSSLPSTFQGTHGSIMYEAKVNVDRPYAPDWSSKSTFTVHAEKRLSDVDNVLMPKEVSGKDDIGYAFFSKKPVSVVLRTDRHGFSPGDNVNVTAYIKNESDRDMDSTRISLLQKVTYSAPGATKTEETLITEVEQGGVMAGRNMEWGGIVFPISVLPPTDTSLADIISIRYCVECEMRKEMFGGSVEVKCPITIASVPFIADGSQAAAQPYQPPIQPQPSPSPGYQQPQAYPPPQPTPGYQPQPSPGYQPQPSPGYQPPQPTPGYQPSPGYPLGQPYQPPPTGYQPPEAPPNQEYLPPYSEKPEGTSAQPIGFAVPQYEASYAAKSETCDIKQDAPLD